MKFLPIITALILLIAFSGCARPSPSLPQQQAPASPPQQIPPSQDAGISLVPYAAGDAPQENASTGQPSAAKSVKYENAISFHTFTDPNEGAFTLDVPDGWSVTPGSGLVRPYIDAGVAFEAKSPEGQSFLFQDPYGYIYATPNQILNYAGFSEGSLYSPSGGKTKPMIVKGYMRAADFADGLLASSDIRAANVKTMERPDLLVQGNPLITQQSASETTFDYFEAEAKTSGVLVVRTALVELSGTGIWSVSVMEYQSPEALMNQTELAALNMQRTFQVDAEWAKRESEELNKRLGAISQSQNGVSATISSVFETRSASMDRLNTAWDNAILGVEDVYNPDTGSHYVVDSGSSYYWSDPQGNIYGTATADSPLPGQDLHPLDCPGC